MKTLWKRNSYSDVRYSQLLRMKTQQVHIMSIHMFHTLNCKIWNHTYTVYIYNHVPHPNQLDLIILIHNQTQFATMHPVLVQTRTIYMQARTVATCKPGLISFSETLALFFIRFLPFQKMKVQDRQNGSSKRVFFIFHLKHHHVANIDIDCWGGVVRNSSPASIMWIQAYQKKLTGYAPDMV